MNSKFIFKKPMTYVFGFGFGSVGSAMLGAGIGMSIIFGIVGVIISHFIPDNK